MNQTRQSEHILEEERMDEMLDAFLEGDASPPTADEDVDASRPDTEDLEYDHELRRLAHLPLFEGARVSVL